MMGMLASWVLHHNIPPRNDANFFIKNIGKFRKICIDLLFFFYYNPRMKHNNYFSGVGLPGKGTPVCAGALRLGGNIPAMPQRVLPIGMVTVGSEWLNINRKSYTVRGENE
jgi:hypothetical protein